MKKQLPFWTLILAAISTFPCHAVAPKPEEVQRCQDWADQVFRGQASESGGPGGNFLKILFEDVPDSVTRGKSWRGTPYQLGDKVYAHGLAFNAIKHVQVHLGSPGKGFKADVGLENNDDTRRGEAIGQGSVRFQVLVAGKQAYSSPVLRRKDGPRAVDVALGGQTEFELRVDDGGDGRGWDQALWAEAVVLLENGQTVRLQDIPWAATNPNPFGFSFVMAGTNSAEVLKAFRVSQQDGQARQDLVEWVRTYLDPRTGLEARVNAVRFKDFPALEWVVHFTNKGSNDTPVLENITALDSALPFATSGAATLHWARGGVASFDDFQPQAKTFKAGESFRLQPGGGRSSSQVLPFFNLEGAGSGVVAVIGWSGEWAAEFTADSRGGMSMKSGMDRTRLVLHPGESIRTPRMLLLFYEGDRWQGQNLLRRFILAHHRPTLNGQPLVAPITCGNWGGTRAEVHLDNIRKINEQQLPIAYYWIDAEWYGQGGWPVNVGNWQVKRDLYPEGFSPLSRELRKSGRELMLWFEPERVFKGTPWHKEHRKWLLESGGDSLLWNLGDPAARKFLTDFISEKIREFGLGCYRQDFNIDPLPFWRAADAADRQGITEIRYIEGLYAFWDELLAKHPGLVIDNCASGGRRIDLETVGRATPFWRTDGPRDATAHQCHTYGLLPWVPLSATSQDRPGDNYEFRSSMCSALCLNWWVAGDVPAERIPADFPYDWARATLKQYMDLRPFYYGDYYPLTGYSQSGDVWLGYQLALPEHGKGILVALRRPDSPYESARVTPRDLGGPGTYRFTNLDTQETFTLKAAQVQRDGVVVSIKSQPGSAVVLYERLGE